LKLINHISILLSKEIRLEWRNKYAFNGILLYVAGSIFVCFLSFNVKKGVLNPITWNAVFWIILLFSAVNAVSKSFVSERENRQLYYYTLVSAEAMILSKIIYNSLLLLLISLSGLLFYSLVMGNPVQDLGLYIFCVLMASLGFANGLTLVAAIASKTQNNGTLMAILGFPIILPVLLLAINISKNALDGLDRSVSLDEIYIFSAINCILGMASWILFPFVWRS
jgi:heme exporter protein B